MQTWTARSVIAATTAIALSLVVMLLTVNWQPALLLATGALTLALVGVAHPAALPGGSCPSCKAAPRNQRRTVLSCQIAPNSQRADSSWVVSSTVERFCTNCKETRKLIEECHVPAHQAATPAEAVVLVSSGKIEPSRILTSI